MSAILRECPKCSKTFKGPGLNGHLRFTHRIPEAEALALANAAKILGTSIPTPPRALNPVYRLMDELMEIHKRRAELKPLTSALLTAKNPTVDKALALLDAMEKEISTKLDELKRQKGLPVGFWEELDDLFGMRRAKK